MITALRNRLYADFLMPSRLDAYTSFLETALTHGYDVLPLGEFWAAHGDSAVQPTRRVLVLRHDIDTDPATGGSMWRLERELGIRSSWFFRLSTLDRPLMKAIADAGGEVSYHYEEVATVAKRRRLRERAAVLAALPEAREEFADNIRRLRADTGLPMRVVASHGDFVNQRVGVYNFQILQDAGFRSLVDIELEAYDSALLDRLGRRHSDLPYPAFWEPSDPVKALEEELPVVFVLVHPRHWQVNRPVNFRDDVRRLVEEVSYSFVRRA